MVCGSHAKTRAMYSIPPCPNLAASTAAYRRRSFSDSQLKNRCIFRSTSAAYTAIPPSLIWDILCSKDTAAQAIREVILDHILTDAHLPGTFADEHGNPVPHKRLRGGKNHDHEQACPGSQEPWAIKQGLRLGLVTHTEVLEVQLHDPATGRPLDRVTAYSLAVALRRALAQWLGVEEREIGCTVTP